MSGGAYDYIEFVPERMLSELERFNEVLNDESLIEYAKTDHRVKLELDMLALQVEVIKIAISSINTDFLHRAEWRASGDTMQIYPEAQ